MMSSVDPEIKALQDSIFLRKVQRARETSVSEKLATGPDLFDEQMDSLRSIIESDNPTWSSEQVDAELDRRLKIAKRISERGIYTEIEWSDE